jgi:hypothetical protein
MMEPWAIAVLSFLGGALLTAFGYTFAFSSKLTKLETLVQTLVETPTAVPEAVTEKLTEVCATAKELEKRVDRLEQAKAG